ncbi:MAG: ATP-binding protein [Anaerolineales bacterium]
MFKSIRSNIAFPIILIVIFTMLALGGFYAYYFNKFFYEMIRQNLLANARFVSLTLTEKPITPGQELDTRVKQWANILGEQITIIDSQGNIISDSLASTTQPRNFLDLPEINQAQTNDYGIDHRRSSRSGLDTLYIAIPIKNGDILEGFVRVAIPLDTFKAKQIQLMTSLGLVMLLGTIVIALLILNVLQIATRPIDELTKSIAKLSENGFKSDWKPKLVDQERDDEVSRFTSAFNYLTEQLHTQIQALENERNKISAVLQEMTDGVLIIDKEGTIQLVNPAVKKMLNLGDVNLIGKSIMQALDYPHFIELWQRGRDTKETQSALIEIQPKKLYIQCTTVPLDQVSQGSVLMILQNLTRQRYLETVRRDFISNISHELRTPLASLKALTETLQEGALEDPPAARKFLIQIENEVDSLSHMVSELLELSRIESGQVPLRLRPASPHEILEKVVERLGLQAERAGIQVITECSPFIPDVLADPQRLEQVLGNLFHNAIKFTPRGGKITLSARSEGDKVLFSVKDTGIGIPAEDIPRIFERFYKTDRARASGGTGLGLAIAKHVVEAHGGIIWAESIERQGSTFYFLIPQAPNK